MLLTARLFDRTASLQRPDGWMLWEQRDLRLSTLEGARRGGVLLRGAEEEADARRS